MKLVLSTIAIALVAAANAPAWADEEATKKKNGDSESLDQVIVTATRREESVQELPEAITAITSEQLDALNAQSFEDYFRTVPGLVMNSTGSGLNRFDFSLRGISSFNFNAPPTSATVGVYVDEIPVTAAGQQVDPRLIDIDRIEVLRGPQGTYFGEDSLGGTIRLITKKPNLGVFLASAESRFSRTSHGGPNDMEGAMINLPLISDKLALRANYFNAHDDGFIDGVTLNGQPCGASTCEVAGVTQRGLNHSRESGERGMLLFQPIDRVSILAEAIHTYSVQDDTATYAPKIGDLMIVPTGEDDTYEQTNLYNVSVNVDIDFAEVVSSSSWGYRNLNNARPGNDPFTGAFVNTGVMMMFDSFTQEIRLISAKNAASRWDYIAGLYFSRLDNPAYGYGPPSPNSFNFHQRNEQRDKAGFGEVGYQITDKLIARLGVRHQTVDYTRSSTLSSGQISGGSGSNTPTTGRVTLNYNLAANEVLYGSVSKGYRPGGINNTLNPHNPSQPIPGINPTYDPDTTTNYELGWKLSFPAARATLNGALYHIDWQDIQVMGQAKVPGDTSPQQFFHNVGAAKVDGLELEGGADVLPQLVSGLRAQMSFAFMNPVITRDQPLPADTAAGFADSWCARGCPARDGDQIPFVPKLSGSFTLTYHHPLGFANFNGFAALSEQYLGRRYTDFAGTWRGPSQPDAPCQNTTIGGNPGGGMGGGISGGGAPTTCARTHTGDVNKSFRVIPASLLSNLQIGIENAHWRASLYAENLFNRRDPILIIPAVGVDQSNQGDLWYINTPRTLGVWIRRTFD